MSCARRSPTECINHRFLQQPGDERHHEAKRDVPHIYLTVEARIGALQALRAQLNDEPFARAEKLSINDLIFKAQALALLKRVPACNVEFAHDGLMRFSRADISVAVSIPDGLMTPVIVDAGARSLTSISRSDVSDCVQVSLTKHQRVIRTRGGSRRDGMNDYVDVLIVGAGHGGAQAAAALRQLKFEGSIEMIGDEQELPYERPPLSKEYLSGGRKFDRILIRPATFWTEKRVTMRMGCRVVAVDSASRAIFTETGGTVHYGSLIWATGGNARRLGCSGGNLDGVHSVRTRADVDRMVGEIAATSRVCIVGGGYIGLEAAAVLANLGKQVTVLEAQDRVLARVSGPILSRFYEAEHRAHGVDVRLNVAVECIVEEQGRASGVRLASGELLDCEMVIVGIGIVPAVEPLLAAGARGGNGVFVDQNCLTTLPHVYAIGDCALHANDYASGIPIRLESVQNANDMAVTAARAIMGAPKAYRAVPWFWSNQYDLRLQTVGLSTGYDEEVLRGDPTTRSFSVVYLKDGKVLALDCINATKDYAQGRSLVENRMTMTATRLADASTSLKSIAIDG